MRFIMVFSADHGYSPSIKEITVALDLRSTATTQLYVNQLVKECRLERDAKRSRTLRVVL